MENREGKKGAARLLELAFTKKPLVLSSCIFSVISQAVSFIPFIAVYYILREFVLHFNDLGSLNAPYMLKLGVLACIAAAAAVFINFIALVFSHIAAFGTLYKLKVDFTRHIAHLPLGFHTENSTGKLRKIVDENIEKLEGFIAHQLPDMAASLAAPIFALIILFVFDWRLGAASLVPIILGYLIQARGFTSEDAKVFIGQYLNSLEDMNSAAVEYVRGISVVKAFNQTVFSFRKFNETIDNYSKFVRAFTLAFEAYQGSFLVIINHIYVFLLPVIILLSFRAADYGEFAMASIFYLIFSFSLASPFIKLLYLSHIGQEIIDNTARMDALFAERPLAPPNSPKEVDEYTVSFEDVHFSYNSSGPVSALNGVSFTAKQGELTALVGVSGSGKSTLAHLIPRFYDVSAGAIKIGGVNIKDMTEDYLMSIVSFVF
ncbi:MAG: ABC transporter ATP-binding protein/permease, partial [Deferribacteraceae bacterium]|nr:ABC transporter ATP-binding protein/permease [Deferribacteraceae bacterium]